MSCLRDVRGQHQNLYQQVMNSVLNVTFAAVGIIAAVYGEGERVDVKSAMLDEFGEEVLWCNLELVHTGSKLCLVKVAPQVGDNVIVLGMQNFVPTQQEDSTPLQRANFMPYSSVTMKAVQISPQSPSAPVVSVSVTDSAVEINSTVDVTLKCDGNVTATANQFDFNSGALTVTS